MQDPIQLLSSSDSRIHNPPCSPQSNQAKRRKQQLQLIGRIVQTLRQHPVVTGRCYSECLPAAGSLQPAACSAEPAEPAVGPPALPASLTGCKRAQTPKVQAADEAAAEAEAARAQRSAEAKAREEARQAKTAAATAPEGRRLGHFIMPSKPVLDGIEGGCCGCWDSVAGESWSGWLGARTGLGPGRFSRRRSQVIGRATGRFLCPPLHTSASSLLFGLAQPLTVPDCP